MRMNVSTSSTPLAYGVEGSDSGMDESYRGRNDE
jgi:hypothetical protein